MDYQIDLNQCYKTINNIGSTSYQNICDGSVETVAWGTGDWLSNGMGILLIAITTSLIVAVVYLIYKAVKEQY